VLVAVNVVLAALRVSAFTMWSVSFPEHRRRFDSGMTVVNRE